MARRSRRKNRPDTSSEGGPVSKRSKRQSNNNNDDDGPFEIRGRFTPRRCSKCCAEVYYPFQAYFNFTHASCECIYCVRCMTTELASGNHDRSITCSCDDDGNDNVRKHHTSFRLTEARVNEVIGKDTITVKKALTSHEFIISPLDERLDCIRHFRQNNVKQDPDHACLIHVGSKNRVRRNGSYKNSKLDLQISKLCVGDAKDMEEGDMASLELIGKRLHPLLITYDLKMMEHRHQPHAAPTERSINHYCQNDNSLLNRFFFTIGYGESMKEVKDQMVEVQDESKWKKLFMTSTCASDIVRHMRSTGNQGFMKNLLGSYLLARLVPPIVIRLLNSFGLSPSPNTIQKEHRQKANKEIATGYDFSQTSKFDSFGRSFDNFGCKSRHGKRAKVGYVQMTLDAVFRISMPTLIEYGFYYDPAQPEKPVLDRTPRHESWWKWIDPDNNEDTSDMPDFELLLQPMTSDEDRLARTTYDVIHMILKMESDGQFPTYEETEQMLEENCTQPIFFSEMPSFHEYGIRGIVEWGDNQIPTEIGMDWIRDIENDSDDVTQSILNPSAGATLGKTLLDANDAYFDIPMDLDLSKEETVKVVAKRCQNDRESILEKAAHEYEAEAYNIERGMKPLLEEFAFPMCGDGQPINQAERAVTDGSVEEDKCLPILGGFHLMLMLWKAMGKTIFPIAVQDMFSITRPSDGQMKWIKAPGDPTSIESEAETIVNAIYLVAIRSIAEEDFRKRQTEGENDEPDDGNSDSETAIKLTPVEVVDYILKLIEDLKDPLVLIMLSYLRLVHVSQLLHKSEGQAKIDLFNTGMKYCAIIACVAHHTSYVDMITNWFKNWHVGSDAFRVFLDKVCIFRKTQNGRNIFSDRFMEWLIGKFYKKAPNLRVHYKQIPLLTDQSFLCRRPA